MNTEKQKLPYKHSAIAEQIISGYYAVYNTLGYGFLEKVYENALVIELRHKDLKVAQQMPIAVYYAGEVIGEYCADLLVAEQVIAEIKATRTLLAEHEAQLLNYLKATPYEVGLLLDFGPKPEHKRRAFENTRKEWWVAQHGGKDADERG